MVRRPGGRGFSSRCPSVEVLVPRSVWPVAVSTEGAHVLKSPSSSTRQA